MSYDTRAGREDLLSFEDEQPESFWRADSHARRVIGHWAGPERMAEWEPALERFGADCAGLVDRAVRLNNFGENLPALQRFSPYGERAEEVQHHPSFHLAGQMIYGSGQLSGLERPGGNLRALAMFYLSSHNGEAGHNCPVACTAGLIKSLRALGSPELQERYMPRLLSTDYSTLAHGAQFLTEVQGGSDVGANAAQAVPLDAPGTWRLHGEKWFCSNITADLILMTARPRGGPEGTRGLGLFLVPRRLPDGSLNAFTIRRLKDKIGTRTLPTAEIDLNGAVAYGLGPVEQGFRNMMAYVIDTSRVYNAVGCCGIARRACLVAHGYAAHRKGFGARILDYPLVQEQLADMRSETAAMVSGTFYLIQLIDRVERGEAGEGEAAFARVGINLNKRRTALSSHEIVVHGIELLGGNGTVEDFSVLPRLLRDNVVFENWEGSHNTLLVQVLRDCRRKAMHEAFFAHLAEITRGHGRVAEAVQAARAELEGVLAGDEALATLALPSLGSRMAWLVWAAAMAQDGTPETVVAHFLDRRLGPAAARDGDYLARIGALAREP